MKHRVEKTDIESQQLFLYLDAMNEALLETNDLRVHVAVNGDNIAILHNVNLTIHQGEIFALVGESGSGKSTFANSLTNIFSPHMHYTVDGSVLFSGQNLLQIDKQTLRQIRSNRIRYIFQEPAQALNPILRIKTQFNAIIRNSAGIDSSNARERTIEHFTRAGIPDPESVLNSYPHQLSGGMLQRILIAFALSTHPDLVVADEPTSSLDAPLRFQLLDLLAGGKEHRRYSILLVTHDLDIARRYADTIGVLYAGRLVEVAPKDLFFSLPLHPYSQMLVNGASMTESPDVHGVHAGYFRGRSMPPLTGCKFYPECSRSHDDCQTGEPDIVPIDGEREVRCLYWK